MEGLAETLQWIERAAYTAITVVSVRLALRHRDAATGWAAGAFAGLETIVLVGAFAGPDGEDLPDGVVKVLLAIVLLFPYCLYRFTTAYARPPKWSGRAAAGLTGVLVGWALLLPAIPERGAAQPLSLRVFAFAVLAQWALLSGWATTRLWLAARHQPTLPRRRLRLLGLAALGLTMTVAISVAAGGRRTPEILLGQQVLGLTGGVLFYTALNPPRFLRRSWRRAEEHSLREAAVAVTAATTEQEVARALLPAIAPLFGGGGALLAGDAGELHGVHGLSEDEAGTILERVTGGRAAGPGEPEVMGLRLRNGWLAVRTSPYSPVFGQEEAEQLTGIGLFVELALDRARRYETDRRLVHELQRMLDLRSRLVSSVSHELRTPLTSIVGFSETLGSRWDEIDEADRRMFVERIAEHGRELTRLVDGLLDYATVEAGRVTVDVEAVDLELGVEAAIEALAPVLAGRRVDVEMDPVRCTVLTNPVLLRRTLTNLLTNAVKYSPPETPIRVRTLRTGDRCRIEVTDRGPGLTREEAERAFEPFWRGERDSGRVRGAGIGLSLVREYARLMGAEVDVESEPGRGSTFYVTLPMARAPVASPVPV